MTHEKAWIALSYLPASISAWPWSAVHAAAATGATGAGTSTQTRSVAATRRRWNLARCMCGAPFSRGGHPPHSGGVHVGGTRAATIALGDRGRIVGTP